MTGREGAGHRRLAHVIALLMVGASIGMTAGCGSGPKDDGAVRPSPQAAGGAKRFIFITNGDDPFWDACNAGLQEGARRFGLEDLGLRAVMEKNNGTAQGQIEKLRQYGSQSDVAGVAISVIQADNVAIVEEMKNLAAKGVKVKRCWFLSRGRLISSLNANWRAHNAVFQVTR